MEFEPVIGLEIHAQLSTESKIFCSCSTEFGCPPNQNTCPVCLGLPGSLPVLNQKVIEYAVKLGLATNCSIRTDSQFARKNYFYPDLPKAYQISQYERPICERGHLEISTDDGQKQIGITRIHLEEDAGKLLHQENSDSSSVDLNRAGIPLVEIVSEPELSSSEEAKFYMEKMHAILTALGICSGDMEKGHMRCDANVSIRPKGQKEFGTRTEIKNLNSFRFVKQAIDYEIERHREEILDGRELVQETRLWDSERKLTFSMRSKEEAEEYRYFPDPDLPVVELDTSWVDGLRESLPELPDARKLRYREKLGLSEYDAEVLSMSGEASDYFEKVLEAGGDPKQACNWILGDMTRMMNEKDLSLRKLGIKPGMLAELISLIQEGIISGKMAKNLLPYLQNSDKSVKGLVEAKGLVQVSDEQELLKMIDDLIQEHAAQVEEYRGGKTKVLGFFVGQLMKQTQGKANPGVANKLIKSRLDG
ncbi:MAG: Asp-tRNA(Asn)/Glu-tRNA(Gln) amidotransferase subunit GatB [bacterium]